MRERWSQYLRPFHSKKPLSSLNKTEGFCSFSITPQKMNFTYLKNGEIQFCESVALDGAVSWKIALTELVERHYLKGVNSSWLLQPTDYQLLTIEALPVTPAEFQSAVRWKIKELLTFPVEDTLIDSFPLPQTKLNAAKNMITVVVARLSYIAEMAEDIRQTGLNLKVIDIPEMAFRNVLSLFADKEKSIALVYLREKQSELVIAKEKTFYFSRQLELDMYSAAPNAQWENLVLEIQRSLDYYQSQWRSPSAMRLLVSAALNGPTINVTEFLTKKLFVPAEALDMMQVLASRQPLSLEQQGEYLPVIGAVLRNRDTL